MIHPHLAHTRGASPQKWAVTSEVKGPALINEPLCKKDIDLE